MKKRKRLNTDDNATASFMNFMPLRVEKSNEISCKYKFCNAITLRIVSSTNHTEWNVRNAIALCFVFSPIQTKWSVRNAPVCVDFVLFFQAF